MLEPIPWGFDSGHFWQWLLRGTEKQERIKRLWRPSSKLVGIQILHSQLNDDKSRSLVLYKRRFWRGVDEAGILLGRGLKTAHDNNFELRLLRIYSHTHDVALKKAEEYYCIQVCQVWFLLPYYPVIS